jgi:capsular exopolysaccharide synthesis family protein
MDEKGSNGSGSGSNGGPNGSGGLNRTHQDEAFGAIERRNDALTLSAEASRPSPAIILADQMSRGLPLRDYLRILHKHRWMILAVVAVMVSVVTVVSFRTRPIYEAVSRLEINGEVPDLANLRELFLQMPTSDDFIQTQVRILESDDLAIQTVRALRLYDKPEFAVRTSATAAGAPFTPVEEMMLIGAFKSRLRVEAVRSSRLVDVHFESIEPKLAADAANTLADLYVENNFRKKYDSTMQATEWMSGQLREVKTKMEESHEALVKYERDNQIFSLNEGQNVTLTKLGDLNREVTEAEGERIARESQAQLVASRRLDDLPAVAQSPLIQDLEKRLSQLEDDDVEACATLGPKHPRVLRLERQSAEIKAQLEREKQQVANRIESEYEAALKREQLLRKSLERQEAEANVLNSKLVEYSLLKREYETNQQLYESLLERLKEAGISSGLRSSNIHVVDRARPPLTPIRPKKTTNILMSLVVGLVLGAVLALFNEYLDNSVKVPEDVEHLVNLPVLGIIPSVSSVNGRGGSRRTLPGISPALHQSSELATVSHPQSVVSEAYRALRTSILLSTSKQPPQTILVSSGQPREGKTTTALNLSITLAQRGDRVALIDTDLRRPRVHRTLGLTNDRGLSSFLAGNMSVDELPRAIRQIPNLFVITSGPTPPNPAELLSSEAIEGLFHELRRQFDFIVMDSPPAITVADSMILAAHADGVMLVVHGAVTTRETLKHTTKLMTSVNARVIGVVLNNVNIRSVDYKYYYTNYYGDYYRHMLEGNTYGFAPEEREPEKGVKVKR